MGCFYHFCPSQELRPSLTDEDIKRGSRRRELDELRRGYINGKGFTALKCGNVSDGIFTRQPLMFNYKSERISLTDDHL